MSSRFRDFTVAQLAKLAQKKWWDDNGTGIQVWLEMASKEAQLGGYRTRLDSDGLHNRYAALALGYRVGMVWGEYGGHTYLDWKKPQEPQLPSGVYVLETAQILRLRADAVKSSRKVFRHIYKEIHNQVSKGLPFERVFAKPPSSQHEWLAFVQDVQFSDEGSSLVATLSPDHKTFSVTRSIHVK